MAGNYSRKVILLIIIFSVLRWITASVMELGNDEAYYWLYSQQIQWNYFDHPPAIAVWIRLFTLNNWLAGNEGVLRAGSIISCAFSTWFIYKTVSTIRDERAGWFAACLFNASLYAGMIAGVLVMPDSPQLFFWTLCLWYIAKTIQDDQRWKNWLILGLAAGFCTLSKIHGLFLWSGLGLFVLFHKREWLRLPKLYLSFALSLLIMSPIFFWNLEHDFITWRFHTERIDISQDAPIKDGLPIEILQQVLINNPFNVALMIGAFFFFKRKKILPALAAFNCIAIPLLLAVLVISPFRDTWFHWNGPAYITLIPLAAIYLSTITAADFPRWLKWSTGFFLIALTGWPLFIRFYPGTYGSQAPVSMGKGDPTLDKFGWKEAGEQFAALYQVEHTNSTVIKPLICPTWWGAHVEYYFARPASAPMIALGAVNKIGQFAWLNNKRMATVEMDTAYGIVPSIEAGRTTALFDEFYRHQRLIAIIPVYRMGKPVSYFRVYRYTQWKKNEQMLKLCSILTTGSIYTLEELPRPN